MMTDSITIPMKKIFKNLSEFESYLEEIGIDGDFKIFIAPYVYWFYLNSNICYDTPCAFKRHLAITLVNISKKYAAQHKIINKMYDINIDDLDVVNKVVNIMAENDNSKVIDPLDTVLEYVNNQAVSQQKMNKVAAYYESINKLSDDVIEEYIDTIRKHFVTVLYNPTRLIETEEITDE